MNCTKKKLPKISKFIVILFFLKTTHYLLVLILNTLMVDKKCFNSIKFLFKLTVFAVNITFFTNGQQIKGINKNCELSNCSTNM